MFVSRPKVSAKSTERAIDRGVRYHLFYGTWLDKHAENAIAIEGLNQRLSAVRVAEPAKSFAFFGHYIEVIPNARVVWTNEESDKGAVTRMVISMEDAVVIGNDELPMCCYRA